jgi:hypothetical protein
MKLTLKSCLLVLAVGIGMSGVFSTAQARPDTTSCMNLAEACAEGDQRACKVWNSHCRICEIDPDACGY